MNTAPPSHFPAPWGRSLRWITGGITLLFIAIAISDYFIVRNVSRLPSYYRILAFLPLLILIIASLFTIRGYTITNGILLIHRLCWKTSIPLTGLVSAEVHPRIMAKSIRLFGNGGLFSFAGTFRNKTLGNYRAFVTDLHRTIALRFQNRTIVISPEPPDQFIEALRPYLPDQT